MLCKLIKQMLSAAADLKKPLKTRSVVSLYYYEKRIDKNANKKHKYTCAAVKKMETSESCNTQDKMYKFRHTGLLQHYLHGLAVGIFQKSLGRHCPRQYPAHIRHLVLPELYPQNLIYFSAFFETV